MIHQLANAHFSVPPLLCEGFPARHHSSWFQFECQLYICRHKSNASSFWAFARSRRVNGNPTMILRVAVEAKSRPWLTCLRASIRVFVEISRYASANSYWTLIINLLFSRRVPANVVEVSLNHCGIPGPLAAAAAVLDAIRRRNWQSQREEATFVKRTETGFRIKAYCARPLPYLGPFHPNAHESIAGQFQDNE